jgi:hypothetical protein
VIVIKVRKGPRISGYQLVGEARGHVFNPKNESMALVGGNGFKDVDISFTGGQCKKTQEIVVIVVIIIVFSHFFAIRRGKGVNVQQTNASSFNLFLSPTPPMVDHSSLGGTTSTALHVPGRKIKVTLRPTQTSSLAG